MLCLLAPCRSIKSCQYISRSVRCRRAMIGSSECSNIARHSTYHALQGWGFIDGYDVGRPAFFLKRGQDRFLVLGRLAECLMTCGAETQFPPSAVPDGHVGELTNGRMGIAISARLTQRRGGTNTITPVLSGSTSSHPAPVRQAQCKSRERERERGGGRRHRRGLE